MICANCEVSFEKKPKANNSTLCCSRNCSLALWRAKNREKVNGQFRDWLHKNQSTHNQHNRSWRSNTKGAATAHTYVARALSSGELLKQPCSRCGDSEVHAHHYSYERPLDVVWLCPLHHKQVHKEMQLL